MNNYTLPDLILAVAMLLWPICLLCLALLFKKDIRCFLRYRHSSNFETRYSPDSNKCELKLNKTLQLENKECVKEKCISTVKEECIPIEVCKNLYSGGHFIVLEDQIDEKLKMITPNGDIKLLESSLFGEIEEQNLIKFFEDGNLSNEQLQTYENFLSDSLNSSLDDYSEGSNIQQKTEAPYVDKYRKMLINGNTIPSRMLAFVKEKREVSWIEIKNYLTNVYGYTDSGSYSASLKMLLIDNYIKIYGKGENKTICCNAGDR